MKKSTSDLSETSIASVKFEITKDKRELRKEKCHTHQIKRKHGKDQSNMKVGTEELIRACQEHSLKAKYDKYTVVKIANSPLRKTC